MVAINTNELLQDQLEQIANRERKARGIEMSAQTGIQYNARLQQLVREIRKDINQILLPQLRKLAHFYQTDSKHPHVVMTVDNWFDDITATLRLIVDKWSSPEFQRVAGEISSNFIRTADQINRDRFNKDLQRFGIDIFGDSPELLDYVQASIYDNTRLIMSIPSQYLTQVESIVVTNVRAGGRPASIARALTQQFDVTEARARLIARDQTAKVNGDLASKRQQSSGFEYFQWIDSDDARVRDRHEDIANRVTAYGRGIYRWDNPPLSDQGTPIIPGQDFQCRCIARPVLASEVEANQRAGLVRPGVFR